MQQQQQCNRKSTDPEREATNQKYQKIESITTDLETISSTTSSIPNLCPTSSSKQNSEKEEDDSTTAKIHYPDPYSSPSTIIPHTLEAQTTNSDSESPKEAITELQAAISQVAISDVEVEVVVVHAVAGGTEVRASAKDRDLAGILGKEVCAMAREGNSNAPRLLATVDANTGKLCELGKAMDRLDGWSSGASEAGWTWDSARGTSTRSVVHLHCDSIAENGVRARLLCGWALPI